MVRTAAAAPADAPTAARRRGGADLAAACWLLLLVLFALSDVLWGRIVIGLDAATFFYPMYGFLGESLRSGDVPGWNPYHFSGAPFAADPQSGWMYLPAMLLFTLLPLEAAARAYLLLHLAGAGLALYVLARVLGMRVPAALLAGLAYALSGFLWERNVCCFAYTGVAMWLPLMILASELALRSAGWLSRLLWWGAAGLAISQVMASWLGQGSYYALLALGGYLAYRTLLAPPPGLNGARARLGALALSLGATLAWGATLGAAGLLPRVEYNLLSSLAGGYAGTLQAVVGGWTRDSYSALLRPSNWYAGAATLSLALLSPLLARGRHAAPYWAALSVVALVLAGHGPTPLHTLAYLLPGFERLHPHSPERILMLFFLGAALLAGAAADTAAERHPGAGWRALALLAPLGLLAAVRVPLPDSLARPQLLVPVALVLAVAALAPLLPGNGTQARLFLVLVVALDLLGANRELLAAKLADPGSAGFGEADLEAYYAPGGAADFLAGATRNGRARYLGYNPAPYSNNQWNTQYRYMYRDPAMAALLVNNRATLLQLPDVQGYNPTQVARYAQYLNAMNSVPQDYRSLYVYDYGLDSPLLDLLNARYIVVPTATPPDRADLPRLDEQHRQAYADGRVRVLENREALPRAWLVHDARVARPGEAPALLEGGRINPRTTAILERPAPPLGRPSNPAAERAAVVEHAPDSIRLSVSAGAPGLLVLSEVYYPAWKAYVDGEPAELYVADHALRAVPVPAGEHTVELFYESWTLRLGLAITAAAYALLATLAALSLRRRWAGAG